MGKSPLGKALAAVTGQAWVCKGTGILREPKCFSDPDTWLTVPPGLLITHHTITEGLTQAWATHTHAFTLAWTLGTQRQAWKAGLWPRQMRLAMLDVVS